MGFSNKQVIIIGAGFAGLQAMHILSKKKGIDTLVINPEYSTFKPSLPEVILGKMPEEAVSIPTKEIVCKAGARYHRGTVVDINRKEKTVTADDGTIHPYDRLLITAGSIAAVTSPTSFALLETKDALALRATLLKKIKTQDSLDLLVAGGGYTGIELITALARLCKIRGIRQSTFRLVEHHAELLPHLRNRVRIQSIHNLKKSGVQIHCSSHFEQKKGADYLNEEKIHPDIIAVTAGLRGAASGILPSSCDEKTGRLITDRFLQVKEDIFAAGDAAYFIHNEKPLRQSVNFAYYGGRTAAKNTIASLYGKKMRPFKPRDLGYLIPNYATGRASGASGKIYLGGRIGMLLHSLMAIFRAFSWKQRLQFLRGLFRKPK